MKILTLFALSSILFSCAHNSRSVANIEKETTITSNGECISSDGINYDGNEMIGIMKKGRKSIEVTPEFEGDPNVSAITNSYGLDRVSFGNTVHFYKAIHVDERSIWAGIKKGKKVGTAKNMACRFYNHD